MGKLTFFKQVRVDGGVRTGVDSESDELLQRFDEGSEDTNPVLLWAVDIRCKGDRLPCEGEAARQWFLANRNFFVSSLRKAASDELPVGYDPEYVPGFCRTADGPDGSQVELAVSALRRVDGRTMGEKLRQIADSWDSMLEQLLLPSGV